MNIEEILQDMIRNDDEQDKEASEWMSEGGGGDTQAPCLANCQGFEPCMDDPKRAYCIPKIN